MSGPTLSTIPDDLPKPEQDGAADHLKGMQLPSIALASTDGGVVDVGALPQLTVLYAYPRTGRPDEALPDGWDAIPGARGCTPQACSFRDHKKDLEDLGASVFALSTQSTAYQTEMVQRLHLPFPVLSDDALALTKAMNLPTISVDIHGKTEVLINRLTLIVFEGRIERVFYPVFPPDTHINDVLAYLKGR